MYIHLKEHRELISLLWGMISEDVGTSVSWSADCVRESKEEIYPTVEVVDSLGYQAFEKKGNIYIPEVLHVTIRPPHHWGCTKESLKGIVDLIPTGGKDGYKACVDLSFGRINIFCDVHTDIYRLLLDEGILTHTYPKFYLNRKAQ